jgi:hypothetical protein
MNMTYNDITSNTAGNNGGCMSFDDNINIQMYSNTFNNNIASVSGGVGYFGNAILLESNKSLFHNNSCLVGNGGVFNAGMHVIMHLHNSSINENKA